MPAGLELELIHSSSFRLSKSTSLGAMTIFVGCTIAIFMWKSYLVEQAKQSAIENQVQRMQVAQRKSAHTKTVTSYSQINAEELNALQLSAHELAIPWNDLFSALEQSGMNDIALLGLQPDIKKQQVIISGEAKDYQSIILYINRLAKQPVLTEVYLQKHAINDSDKDKPVRFSLFAHWLIPRSDLVK